MAGFFSDDPPHQRTKSRKPDSGKLPELLSFRIPLDAYHFGFPVFKLSIIGFD
jgi:hypothetical protein